jgi:hypothetical protein
MLVFALASPALAGGGDDEHVSARGELGVEYDDNVHRVEQIPTVDAVPVASPLTRAVVAWSASDRLSDHQDVAFSVRGGMKLFAASAARSENVGIVDTSGAWRIAPTPRTRIGLTATYYEAIQAGTYTERALSLDARDFRSLSPSLRLARSFEGWGTVGMLAGYRTFVYKPLRSYDFQAPVLGLEHRLTRETADGDADWDVISAVGVELRRFAGVRLVEQAGACAPVTTNQDLGNGQPCAIFDPAGTRHVDQFFTGQVDVTRTGRVLVGAGYAIQWNRSNSDTESLVRHVGSVRFTTPLPLGLYLAARAELVYVTYPQRVPIAYGGPSGQVSASIEEETRSQVRAELSRDLTDHLQLVGRYSLYANALGQGQYRRQTAMLSLVYTIDD